MNYRTVGTTDLKVSEISFGCWTMGGLNWVNGSPNGWANVDEGEVTAAIKVGLDAGVNHWDNADVYGNGRAERMLARCFDALGVKTTSQIIATKVGHFPGTAEHAFDKLHIRHQCEQSLKNLKRDYIDIYYLHHGDFGADAKYLPEAAETVHALKKEGKIRHIGQSAYSVNDFARAVPVVKPVVLQSWANALDDQYIRPGSPLQKLMDEHKLSFVAFSPLAQGQLLGKYDPKKPPTFEPGDIRAGSKSFQEENLTKLEPKIAKLKARFGNDPGDLVRVALGYVLAQPNVCCAIPGFRNDRQARSNIGPATKPPLSADDVKFIRATLDA
jgi:aryl-alcohol dehydrogenase-like predicted oxidoreductase